MKRRRNRPLQQPRGKIRRIEWLIGVLENLSPKRRDDIRPFPTRLTPAQSPLLKLPQLSKQGKAACVERFERLLKYVVEVFGLVKTQCNLG